LSKWCVRACGFCESESLCFGAAEDQLGYRISAKIFDGRGRGARSLFEANIKKEK
jgi:hypothetical protein